MTDWLHPTLLEALPALQIAWSERPRLRLAPFLRDDRAAALLEALRRQPFQLQSAPPGQLRLQYWACAFRADAPGLDPTLAGFARWWHGPGMAWVAALAGRPLAPPADGQLLSTRYTRGSYLDPHNDYDGVRSIAYVLGLSPAPWPAAEGGHLEFLTTGPENVAVTERLAPAWNALDLFDVLNEPPLHRVPMLTTDRERRVFAGWFYRPVEDAQTNGGPQTQPTSA